MLIHHILLTFRIFIYSPVLASLTDALSGLNNVCWISRLFCSLKGTLAVSINRWELLHIELDVIHLKISFWCLSCCDKTTSNSWSICYRLWESTDIWNSKLVHGQLCWLRRSDITKIYLTIWINVWIYLKLIGMLLLNILHHRSLLLVTSINIFEIAVVSGILFDLEVMPTIGIIIPRCLLVLRCRNLLTVC